jgi:hypothetical protein
VEAVNATKHTYFIMTSDHGFHFHELRLGVGKWNVYDTDVRVPMVMAGPGITAGSVNAVVANHPDLAPTWLAMAGGLPHPEMDGRSILGDIITQPHSTSLAQPHRTSFAQPHSTSLAQPHSTSLAQPHITSLAQPQPVRLFLALNQIKLSRMLPGYTPALLEASQQHAIHQHAFRVPHSLTNHPLYSLNISGALTMNSVAALMTSHNTMAPQHLHTG